VDGRILLMGRRQFGNRIFCEFLLRLALSLKIEDISADNFFLAGNTTVSSLLTTLTREILCTDRSWPIRLLAI
jgi:hypothetical protein